MMSSSVFNTFGNQSTPVKNILERYEQFKNNFSGNPKEQVQQLLNSGKVSQAQYNQAVQMANQLQQFLSKR